MIKQEIKSTFVMPTKHERKKFPARFRGGAKPETVKPLSSPLGELIEKEKRDRAFKIARKLADKR